MADRVHLLLHFLRGFVWGVMDAAVLGLVKIGEPQQRVLIIKTDAIGDFVLWLNAGRELCAHYRRQGLAVVLIANAVWAQWASELGLADEVWALDTHCFVHNLWYRWSWLRRLRRAGFATVIHPVLSRVFLIGDTLVRATHAPERVAPEGDYSNSAGWQKRWSDRWYSRLIPETTSHPMELLRHAEFLRGLGLLRFVAGAPKLPPMGTASQFSRAVSKPYAVLFVGGSWDGKLWQAEKFCEIAQRLRGYGINVVLAGSLLDRRQAAKISDSLNGNAINLVGKTTLSELAELLRNAVVVLSNDTSAVHIAAAVGTPVLCVLGGGHYGRFLPYVVEVQDPSWLMPIIMVQPMSCFGCNWRCIHPREKAEPVKCISDISVEQVWRQLEEVLCCSAEVKRPSVK